MRTNHVQNSLRSISKCIKAHQAAHDDFVKATDTLHALLPEHLQSLATGAEGDPVVEGYLGHFRKLVNAHKGSCLLGKAAHASFHDACHKALAGAASKAHVSLEIGNANDRSDEGATSHGGGDTTSPGEISHGKGLTAAELQKTSDRLSAPTLFSQVQKIVGVPNANRDADPFGKGWKLAPGLEKLRR